MAGRSRSSTSASCRIVSRFAACKPWRTPPTPSARWSCAARPSSASRPPTDSVSPYVRTPSDAGLAAAHDDAPRHAADGGEPALGPGGEFGAPSPRSRPVSASPPPTPWPRKSAPTTSPSAPRWATTAAKVIRELVGVERAGPTAPERILTHCNAGWLAAVDWGTALAPVYKAHEAGIPLHVWVDETRPRSQGASLTAFELLHHGVPHTVVVENVGGHLMQHGEVDLVHRRHRPHRAPTATFATRSARISRRSPRATTACPFYVAPAVSRPFDWKMR